PAGDTRRMGHRHSPEEHGGARSVFSADNRFAASAERPVAAHFTVPLIPTMDANEKSRPTPAPPQGKDRSLARRTALVALQFYKAYLSILFAGSCRFEPTCSRYAYVAIERFGVARGVWLGLKRLLHCPPLSPQF